MPSDLETIYRSDSTTLSEMESNSIQNILEASGIPCIVIGDSVLPNLGFEVRVAADRAEEARKLIADALASGPAGAEEGERESEGEDGSASG